MNLTEAIVHTFGTGYNPQEYSAAPTRGGCAKDSFGACHYTACGVPDIVGAVDCQQLCLKHGVKKGKQDPLPKTNKTIHTVQRRNQIR